MQTELNLLLSMRDEMELTLSTYKLEREIMDKDLQSLQSDHDAVKGAYTALEHEVAEGRKLAQGRSAVSQVRRVSCVTCPDYIRFAVSSNPRPLFLYVHLCRSIHSSNHPSIHPSIHTT
jgi:hypothetical protein